jgi:hypothetical protein
MGTRVHYDAESPHGALVAEAIGSIVEARDKIQRVLRAAQSMSYGDTPGVIEEEMGVEAGQAPTILFCLQSISDALNTQTMNDIVAQLDQG